MITNIAIFIGLFILYLFIAVVIGVIAYKEGNKLAAFLLGIGFMFLKPYILMWYMQFILGFHWSYWPSFGVLFVLSLFTLSITKSDF